MWCEGEGDKSTVVAEDSEEKVDEEMDSTMKESEHELWELTDLYGLQYMITVYMCRLYYCGNDMYHRTVNMSQICTSF